MTCQDVFENFLENLFSTWRSISVGNCIRPISIIDIMQLLIDFHVENNLIFLQKFNGDAYGNRTHVSAVW